MAEVHAARAELEMKIAIRTRQQGHANEAICSLDAILKADNDDAEAGGNWPMSA